MTPPDGIPCRECHGFGHVPDHETGRLAERDCPTCAGTGWAVRPR